jgi:hypothetical protein
MRVTKDGCPSHESSGDSDAAMITIGRPGARGTNSNTEFQVPSHSDREAHWQSQAAGYATRTPGRPARVLVSRLEWCIGGHREFINTI